MAINTSGNLIDDAHNDIIATYFEKCRLGIFNRENTDLKDAKALKLYKRYIGKICGSNAQEYLKYSFVNMDAREVGQIAMEIIFNIFGYDHTILQEVASFFNCIMVRPSEQILDGICLEAARRDNLKDRFYIVQMPNLDNVSAIVCLVHEFTHYHCLNNDFDVNHKKYYEEILPIYCEKVAMDIIERKHIQKDITRKVENTRLESIKWHYEDRPSEVAYLKGYYQYLKMMSLVDPNAIKERRMLEEQFPWLLTSEGISKFEEYDKSESEAYGIGYLYAESLFQYSQNDKSVQERIRKILRLETTLQSTLDYYHISASNDKIYVPVEEKIKRLTH